MRTTSRKLKRLIEEEERTMARIAELQEYLKKVRETRKNEEDLEIIRSIRSMKLGARDLFDLLAAIQEGNLGEDLREQLLADAGEEENEPETAGKESPGKEAGDNIHADDDTDPDDEDGAADAPEREENDDDRQHE